MPLKKRSCPHKVQLNRACLTDRLIEVDVFLFAQNLECVFEQFAKALGPLEARQYHDIPSERRR